jgi:hypothetical protein
MDHSYRTHRARPHTFILVALLSLAFSAPLRADTISGTVKDPSGAVVIGARIEITGGDLSQPVVLTSDDSGKFSAPNLKPGKYSVRVAKDGFEDLLIPVDLKGAIDLPVNLTIAPQQTRVVVPEKSLPFANSDPVYRQLRDVGLGDSFKCENFTLTMDVGTFQFKSGSFTLLPLVKQSETGIVFVGQGHFTLKPLEGINARELIRRAGGPTAEEDFTEVVFRFTNNQFPEFSKALGEKIATPADAETAYKRWRENVRRRHEIMEGFSQYILEGESIDNVDADVLAAIYNPNHPAFFNAYMRGTPHKDLRFFIRERVGALQQLDSPEEVALVNSNAGGMDDGVWYSDHLVAEHKARTANSREDKRLFATKRYEIKTEIGKNNHLRARTTLTFESLVPGERVMKFDLLANLRVIRVLDQDGHDLHFIQEDPKADGSFYAILPEPPAVGQDHSITIDYVGDKVLRNAGTGSYYVGAREAWYPNLNGFGEKSLYDLTFKIPPSNVIISVGKLAGQSTEDGFAVSHWVTPVPVAVAGFNYGQYKKIDYPDNVTHYNLAGYYLTDLPNNLRGFQALDTMSPISMTKYALDQTRAQMQVCTLYFGHSPYDTVSITEQPDFFFGQSWPGLVYLPISAYIDATQRWLLFGQINSKFSGFVQEVTPHEVAHQWFGHGVGWASYHDQWLSEGFAEFAAGLFLQQAMGPKWQKDYIDFWERQRHRVLDKNEFGVAPNDAGPLWLGLRLISPHSEGGYQGVTYSKGAYVLSMLRSIMYDDKAPASANPDQPFMDMMHDFMQTHHDLQASTESFKVIVERHMSKQMDLQQNGRLNWFFSEWVYGTLVPRYSFKYELQKGEGGKTKVHAEITQSEVDENFAMLVPLFADFGNGMMRMGQVAVIGNSTQKLDFVLDKQPKKIAINAYKDLLER